ncbi:MAG: restriction endonuclease subunit S [Candidatus Aminicenantes bacterium]|nr:restriction endonuclease subunit S [Candidatus Aminicenantes bacterium]
MVNETSIPAGYKKTEVGVIPEKWETKKLGEIAEINTDNLMNNTNANYSFTYVSLEDVQQGLLKNSTKCVFDSAPSRARRKVQKSDVLLGTVRPNLKSHLFIKNDVKDFICSTGFAVIRSNKNEVKAEYIYYHLFGYIIERQINTLLIGSNYPAINCKEIKSLTIPLPPLPEQEAIASGLSDVDALITALDRLIVKKRNIKQGAMQQLLTGQKRLPGFVGKWEEKTLGEIGECIIGLTYKPENVKESGLLVLRSSNIIEESLAFDDNVYVNIKVPEKLVTKEGDILICVRNGSRELIGKCALIKKKSVGITFGAFMTVYRTPYFQYVFHQFKTHLIKKQIYENIGATINQITNKNLKSFQIPLPPLPEQEAIAQVLSDMDAELEALEKKRAKYNAVKNGMMHQLLTGKTRLELRK